MKTAEELKEFIKNHCKNVRFYQTTMWQNEVVKQGLRGLERRSYIDVNDIKNKNVLDIGSATGSECLWAVENGAKSVIGIDQEKNINTFNKICKFLDIENAKGIAYDLSTGLPKIDEKIDTIFCFSITHNINNRQVWQEIDSDVIYLESGSNISYKTVLKNQKTYNYNFLGYTPGSIKNPKLNRELWRLKRK